MAFKLPPPWDPGYALPENVRDEGLQRRGLVTKQMPRGTYDAPHVGTGGYVVPQYVKQERYGQGAFVTKMLPRGYVDQRVPYFLNERPSVSSRPARGRGPHGRMVTFGDVPVPVGELQDLPKLYQDFGSRGAAAILQKVGLLPLNQRKDILKKILDTIDPSLWRRTLELTDRYKAQGVPAPQALAQGLARAMSTGIASEIYTTGKRGTPRPRSLLGLGCYGVSPLGTDIASVSTTALLNLIAQPTVSTTALQNLLTTANTSKPGYSWVTTGADGSGHWERTRAGAQDVPMPTDVAAKYAAAAAAIPVVDVNVGVKSDDEFLWDAATNQWIKNKLWTGVKPAANGVTIEAGPFMFPLAGARVRMHQAPNEEQKAFISQLMAGYTKNIDMNGLNIHLAAIQKGDYPIAKFTRPTRTDVPDPFAGKEFGLYVKPNPDGTWYIEYREYSSVNILQAVWNGIQKVRAKIHEVVKDALAAVKGLSCDVAKSPAAKPAATVVGAVYGGPAGAAVGAKGADIAKDSCGNPIPQDEVVAAAGNPYILPVAIAGGVALVAILLSKKRKP